MKDKIYLGVIVLLIFAVVISLTSEDAETSALKDKVEEMKSLKKKNADLEKKIKEMEERMQDARTQLAMKAAAAFKRKQYAVNYEHDYDHVPPRKLDHVYEKYDAYATKEYIKKMTMIAIVPSIQRLAQETESNLSVKELTFEVGEMETEAEISLDYDIEIAFDPVSSDGKKRTVTNFGQIRVVKTKNGWKVNEDMERRNGTNEVMSEALLQ